MSQVVVASIDDIYFVSPSTVGDRIHVVAQVNRAFQVGSVSPKPPCPVCRHALRLRRVLKLASELKLRAPMADPCV